MAKVDPDALEREAEELQRQAGMIAEPAPDTPPNPDESPAPQADTDEQQLPATDEDDRGDQPPSSDQAPEGFVSIERYRNAQAAMTKAQQRAAQLEQEVHDVRRLNDELRAGRTETQTAASADEAEVSVQKALEEYPEIVGPILARMKSLEATVQSTSQQAADREKQIATDAHLNAIREKHSDVDDIAGDPEFHGWVSRQTGTWQRVAQNGSAEEVIELLDRYKEAMGLDAPPQRETPLERARKVAEPTLPRSRKPDPNANKRIWTRREISQLSLDQYEAKRDEIDRAYLEGRVR